MLRVATALTHAGHIVTSSWIEQTKDEIDSDEAPQLAERDLEEIRESDVLVHYAEKAGTPGAARGGRFVEWGMAAACGLRLIVVGPVENIFHRLARVEQVGTTAAMLRLLRRGTGKEAA